MNKYTATVIKTGNSYALRVPKSYIDEGQLSLGDKTSLPPAQKQKPQDRERIQQLWKELQALKPFKSIKDPVAWQREIRMDRPLPGRD
jgi:antitoxin component of MazEF toxin-antitoxin module